MRMQRLGAEVTGIDFSEEGIRIAKEIEEPMSDLDSIFSYGVF